MQKQSARPNRIRRFAIAFVLAGCAIAPPVQEMSDARQAIAAAESAGADRWAPDTISDARRFLAEAEDDIAGSAYGPARSNALRAQDRAVRALRQSQAAGASE
jgi:hypothetical protein